MGSDLSITPGDKRIIQSLLLALEPVSNLRGHPVKLRLVTAFLAVATNEGKGLSEYARCLGIHRATISRFIYELADRSRYGGPGLGLISIYEVLGATEQARDSLNQKGARGCEGDAAETP